MTLSATLQKKVNGFSLDIDLRVDNEIAVIFGPSGSGKSMTLQLISGLMQPDAGTISFDGSIFFDSGRGINLPARQRNIGYVFQDLALFPHLSVQDNILFGAKGLDKALKKKRLYDIVSIFHLDGLEDKFPAEISGGQKQRVALARALIRGPAVLLLDEPFSSLDTELRFTMRNFLRDIRKEFQVPIILVTHDIFEAYSLADNVIVYSNGSVVQIGKPQEVFNTQTMPDCETPLFFSYMFTRGFF